MKGSNQSFDPKKLVTQLDTKFQKMQEYKNNAKITTGGDNVEREQKSPDYYLYSEDELIDTEDEMNMDSQDECYTDKEGGNQESESDNR